MSLNELADEEIDKVTKPFTSAQQMMDDLKAERDFYRIALREIASCREDYDKNDDRDPHNAGGMIKIAETALDLYSDEHLFAHVNK